MLRSRAHESFDRTFCCSNGKPNAHYTPNKTLLMDLVASMEDHTHTSRRISQVPELVGFICRCSDYHTRKTMLQVSRQFFETAAPVVWEKVVGVHFLMHLLPGFTATRSQAHTHSRRDNYITMVCIYFLNACHDLQNSLFSYPNRNFLLLKAPNLIDLTTTHAL